MPLLWNGEDGGFSYPVKQVIGDRLFLVRKGGVMLVCYIAVLMVSALITMALSG